MPEGPEVKIASDYFNNFFLSSKKISFEIITEYYYHKYLDIFKTINKKLVKYNPTFTIGKNIFLKISDNQFFNFHLGMTGGWSNKLEKHCHFRVYDNNNNELFFRDVRKFGKMKLIDINYFNDKFNSKYDLLSKSYNQKEHLKFLEAKIKAKKSICSIMMNQEYFPGVGNYIKSESLYQSKIHPEEKWGNITHNKRIDLIKCTKNIIIRSYKKGGAELKDFKNPFNTSQFKLKIYGRKYTNKKNIVISKITSDSRKSWFCPKEQKLI